MSALEVVQLISETFNLMGDYEVLIDALENKTVVSNNKNKKVYEMKNKQELRCLVITFDCLNIEYDILKELLVS